jgi:hypothetical protein
LQSLQSAGFELASLERFPGFVRAKKYGLAALLEPLADGRLKLFSAPGYLMEDNIAVLVERGGEQQFVWKSREVRATPELLADLKRFEAEIQRALEPPV